MPLHVKSNATSDSKEQHNSVYTTKEGGHTATITVSVVVVTAVLVLCSLLCYREITRRRKISGLNEEIARRTSIREAIRHKLQELEDGEDPASKAEQIETKASLVTFGEVTIHNPIQSPVPPHHDSFHGNDFQQQNRYHPPRQPRFYKGSKRRFNHIPYHRDYGQLSYYQQQQIRLLQRQQQGLQNQEHSPAYKQ